MKGKTENKTGMSLGEGVSEEGKAGEPQGPKEKLVSRNKTTLVLLAHHQKVRWLQELTQENLGSRTGAQSP